MWFARSFLCLTKLKAKNSVYRIYFGICPRRDMNYPLAFVSYIRAPPVRHGPYAPRLSPDPSRFPSDTGWSGTYHGLPAPLRSSPRTHPRHDITTLRMDYFKERLKQNSYKILVWNSGYHRTELMYHSRIMLCECLLNNSNNCRTFKKWKNDFNRGALDICSTLDDLSLKLERALL